MSGHSKWSQIKHAKAITDKKKGAAFSKLIRQIVVAVRESGTDPESNFKLRLAIEKAREAEMPKENIERAVEKASGTGEGNQIEQALYEGYGPFGTSFLVEVATDSKNRASSNIRHILESHGGSFGQPGSVAWSFESKGQILLEPTTASAEDLELAAIDAGAEDVKIVPEGVEVFTAPHALGAVRQKLEGSGGTIVNCEVIMSPKNPVILTNGQKPAVERLLHELTESEEVIAVHTSASL